MTNSNPLRELYNQIAERIAQSARLIETNTRPVNPNRPTAFDNLNDHDLSFITTQANHVHKLSTLLRKLHNDEITLEAASASFYKLTH